MQKLTKFEAVEMVKNFIVEKLVQEKWYKDILPYIKAIVLYGSTAKGENRADSDIDVLVFVPLEIEKKYTEGEYVYEYKSREINIVLRSVEKLEKIAKGEHDLFQAEVFRKSQIIFENGTLIRDLIEIIKKQ